MLEHRALQFPVSCELRRLQRLLVALLGLTEPMQILENIRVRTERGRLPPYIT